MYESHDHLAVLTLDVDYETIRLFTIAFSQKSFWLNKLFGSRIRFWCRWRLY